MKLSIGFIGANIQRALVGIGMMLLSATVLTFLDLSKFWIFDLIKGIVFWPLFLVGLFLFVNLFITSQQVKEMKKKATAILEEARA
jgi:hypothetical protein